MPIIHLPRIGRLNYNVFSFYRQREIAKVLASIFNSILDFFKDFEGYEIVDNSLGKLNSDCITAEAKLIAEKQQWFDQIENSETAVKPETYLVQYEFSKKLVWFVYFTHYYTEEERESDYKGLYSMSFAVVRVDDSTGEVIFADFIKPILSLAE